MTKSAWTSSASSVGISSTPISFARSFETYGSNAIMRMPNAAARCATSAPTRPSPTTPSVLPGELDALVLGALPRARPSAPRSPAGCSAPARAAARSCARPPRRCSTAGRSRPSRRGASRRRRRRCRARSRRARRPCRFSAAAMTSAVTCVCERTTSASYGAISAARSAGRRARAGRRPRKSAPEQLEARLRELLGDEDPHRSAYASCVRLRAPGRRPRPRRRRRRASPGSRAARASSRARRARG